jgi:hypothetical protein
MLLIGMGYHPSFQTIAFLMEATGEWGEQEILTTEGDYFCTACSVFRLSDSNGVQALSLSQQLVCFFDER